MDRRPLLLLAILAVVGLATWFDLSHAGSYRDEYPAQNTNCIAHYTSVFAGEASNEAILFGFTLHILTMGCNQTLMYIKVHRVHEDSPIGFQGNTGYQGLSLHVTTFLFTSLV